MARISGVNLPNKPVAIALTYIFGVGRTSAVKICQATTNAGLTLSHPSANQFIALNSDLLGLAQ